MSSQFKVNPWKIIEESFDPVKNEIAESAFSIGNGFMGQRANFEETFTGKTLQGTYLGGVYYPDKTRVGWWKNGYPEYFAKVLNSTNWIALKIQVNGEVIDLNKANIKEFYREIDMQTGLLTRKVNLKLNNGIELSILAKRFYSMVHKDYSALQYSIACSQDCQLIITSLSNGDIKNSDSNYDETFWEEVAQKIEGNNTFLTLRTKKLDWNVCTAVHTKLNGASWTDVSLPKQVGISTHLKAQANETIIIEKHCISATSFHYPKEGLQANAEELLQNIIQTDFHIHFNESAAVWAQLWKDSDVIIEGDEAAQQAIRFNIFHLKQTYNGQDDRLNIGPKGFTGEKYGGSTYWDTEAYCIPFFLLNSPSTISKQLLVYRYKQLGKAIENAEKLGFSKGAALYPMVTMNGEECHNEWEITFEEIHRNGAIAYAIYNYIEHTQDLAYLAQTGLQVLIAISRFWAQRVHFSAHKQCYEMHGVTGPNEYENNVNNNWYTSYIAMWCLRYTKQSLDYVAQNHPMRYQAIVAETEWKPSEMGKWQDILVKMYLPENKELGIFEQHTGFLNKELVPVAELDPKHLPLNQKWSWDRILRSCYIKQADVLQGLYLFERDFDQATHRRNFEFYEPFTVHESSLSPCVHSILACKLGLLPKAYEMYLRTARLDLDNYNNDTEDGLHITSMAGAYLSIVQGFGGVRVWNGNLYLNPVCPPQWTQYSFKVLMKNQPVTVTINSHQIKIENNGSRAINAILYGTNISLAASQVFTTSTQAYAK